MADDRPFLAKARKPTAPTLARALAKTSVLFARLDELTEGFRKDWSHSKSSGWTLKIHDGKKALAYVIPLSRSFRVSLAIREKERATLLADPNVAAVHEALRQAKQYAEGYALRFDVTDGDSYDPVARLLRGVIAARR
jgi:hypothetical protein